MKPTTWHHDIYQGDRFEKAFELVDENGNPFDATGWTAAASAKTDPRAVVAWTYAIEWDSRTGGLGRVVLTATTTGGLQAGTYDWDLEVTNDADAEDTHTPFRGKATVTAQVTE